MPRTQSEFNVYHVIVRGVGKQLIFEDDRDRRRFLDLLEFATSELCVPILAWCLMGNHVHLLMQAQIESVSKCVQCLTGTYAQIFNLRHERSGHLFQGRFKSEPVDTERYLLAVVRYIHFNPEKAAVASHDSYVWSSYGEYVSRRGALRLCKTDLVLGLCGGVKGFEEYHLTCPQDAGCMDIESVRSKTRAMPDDEALVRAEHVLGGKRTASLKALGKKERDAALLLLLEEGLSIRQIERLTGISRGIIQKVRR